MILYFTLLIAKIAESFGKDDYRVGLKFLCRKYEMIGQYKAEKKKTNGNFLMVFKHLQSSNKYYAKCWALVSYWG